MSSNTVAIVWLSLVAAFLLTLWFASRRGTGAAKDAVKTPDAKSHPGDAAPPHAAGAEKPPQS